MQVAFNFGHEDLHISPKLYPRSFPTVFHDKRYCIAKSTETSFYVHKVQLQ